MPPLKLKPSEIAAEAKRTYIPYISQMFPQYPVHSQLHGNSEHLRISPCKDAPLTRLRVAVIDGDPVEVALDWFEYKNGADSNGDSSGVGEGPMRIPIVNMANEKRAGGDWESGLMAPEENLCRRSNLVHCLTSPWAPTSGQNYPIPLKGGIYSPHVVVFRSGPVEGYSMWQDFKSLPVISVAPVRRPKLDESGKNYSFEQEKELMEDKMRTVLRIAAAWHHRDLCICAFGAGPAFRHPVHQLAIMWKHILFSEKEFQGAFDNVVFAIERNSGNSPSSQPSDYDVFKQEFDASNVFKTAYR